MLTHTILANCSGRNHGIDTLVAQLCLACKNQTAGTASFTKQTLVHDSHTEDATYAKQEACTSTQSVIIMFMGLRTRTRAQLRHNDKQYEHKW